MFRIYSTCSLQPGDHIIIRKLCGLYWHHLIVCDVISRYDIEVIHFNGAGSYLKRNAKIRRTIINVKHVMLNDNLYKSRDIDAKPNSEVLRVAESMVLHGDYSLWSNNCEHFARWCRTGRKACYQVLEKLATLLFSVYAVVLSIAFGAVSAAATTGGSAAAAVGATVGAQVIGYVSRTIFGRLVLNSTLYEHGYCSETKCQNIC